MADTVPHPKMDWDSPSGRPQAYKEFKQLSELWFKVKNTKVEDQYSYIILWCGKEGLRMYNTWGLSDEQLKDPKNLWEKFSAQIEPQENFRIHRFEFQRYTQRSSESVDDFFSRCKEKAMKCRFKDNAELEERIIEVLISGMRSAETRKKLLGKDENLLINDALDICRRYESSNNYMEKFNNLERHENVEAVQKENCKNCGWRHADSREKCPAQGTKCANCGKIGHWKRVCQSQSKHTQKQRRSRPKSRTRGSYANRGRTPSSSRKGKVHAMEKQDIADQFESFSFETVEIEQKIDATSKVDVRDQVFAKLDIKLQNCPDSPVHFLTVKVDTGAQGNVLPLRVFCRMFPRLLDADGYPKPGAIRKPRVVLTAYNGTRIPQLGSITIPCRFKDGVWKDTDFYVTDCDGSPILGLPSSRALELISLNCAMTSSMPTMNSDCKKSPDHQNLGPIRDKKDLQDMYPDRFKGIGRFPGEFHITMKDDAQPCVQPPRKYPIQLKDEIKAELDRMESLKVISKVTEATDWVSSLAFSRKDNGGLRICLDPKPLNKATKRTYHKTPTLEEITHQFSGCKVFSKLDARHGYWSVVLDEESSYLTTFNSPFGRYKFHRLPFGLKVSQDIFQEKMDIILAQCPGAVGIADDVGIGGENDIDHDGKLHHFMQVARKYGLIFNLDKCDIKVPRIKFFGCFYDADGVHPDPAKVADVHALPAPRNTNEMQQFLGIVQYMSPFIPNLADRTEPLRALIRKESEWQWTESHQKAFDNVKSVIGAECTLTYFDPKQATVIQVDASMKGLGAALLQNNKPVAFASKALTDTEQRYANIERELLAVVFGCTRFHTYIYGSRFTVESDHKPLENIQHKSLANTPPRLQRMMLRLQPYDFDIVYRPGKEMLLADAMSRLNPQIGPQIPLDTTIYTVTFSKDKMSQLQEQTRQDEELHLLSETIVGGWPDDPKRLPKCIRHYWSCRDELSVDDGFVIKGDRIIIPVTMRNETLEKIHAGHQGVNKCQLRAKSCVYWPGINKDIEQSVRGCKICQEHQNGQTAEPLLPHDIPQRPWQTIGTDLFHLDGAEYLIVADYYSKFPFVRKIHGQSTSKAVITLMKQIFSEQGVPSKVISDNGPQYASQEFTTFASNWGFEHVTSSPRFPQSNGFIERTIQTVKLTLKKAQQSNTDPYTALLCLRTTPVDNVLASPAELLNRRKLNSNLPVRIHNDAPDKGVTQNRLKERQETQKAYHDTPGIRELPPLLIGQHVNVQDQTSGKWTQAVVKNICPEPRSYMVQTPNGSVLRRNRNHLREIQPEKKRVRFADTPRTQTYTPRMQNYTPRAQNDTPRTQNYTPRTQNHAPRTRDKALCIPQTPRVTEIPRECNTRVSAKDSAESAGGKPQYRTRSGRVVKPPIRLVEAK